LLYESFAVHLDLENIETVIWPTLHPWLERNKYLGIARALPRPFFQVMRFESQTELHSPSLFLYNNTPFYGCAAGNNNLHIVELQTGKKATMEFKDYPGFEMTVSYQIQFGCLLTIVLATPHPGLAFLTMPKLCYSLPIHIQHSRRTRNSCGGIFQST